MSHPDHPDHPPEPAARAMAARNSSSGGGVPAEGSAPQPCNLRQRPCRTAAAASFSGEKGRRCARGPVVAAPSCDRRETCRRRPNASQKKEALCRTRELRARGAGGLALTAVPGSARAGRSELSGLNRRNTGRKGKRSADAEIAGTALRSDVMQTDRASLRKIRSMDVCDDGDSAFHSLHAKTRQKKKRSADTNVVSTAVQEDSLQMDCTTLLKRSLAVRGDDSPGVSVTRRTRGKKRRCVDSERKDSRQRDLTTLQKKRSLSVCDGSDAGVPSVNARKARGTKRRSADTAPVSRAGQNDSLQARCTPLRRKRALGAKAPFDCRVCGATYAVFRSVKRHMLKAHGLGYACSLCGLGLEDAAGCRQHERDHREGRAQGGAHREGRVQGGAHREGRVQGGAQREGRVQAGARSKKRVFHYCPLCGAKFAHCYSLTTHMKIHDRSYFCELCNVLFDSSVSFTKHCQTRHKHRKRLVAQVDGAPDAMDVGEKGAGGGGGGGGGGYPRQFKCEVCAAVFVHQATLLRHSIIHDQHKPFVCTVCYTTFRLPLDLKEHMDLHLAHRREPLQMSPAVDPDETSSASSGADGSCAKPTGRGKLVIPKLVKERRYSQWVQCPRCAQTVPAWMDEHKDCVQTPSATRRPASPTTDSGSASVGARQEAQAALASRVPEVVGYQGRDVEAEAKPPRVQVKREPVDDMWNAGQVQTGELTGETDASAVCLETAPLSPPFHFRPHPASQPDTGAGECWESSDGVFSVKLEQPQAAYGEEECDSDLSGQSWTVLVNDDLDSDSVERGWPSGGERGRHEEADGRTGDLSQTGHHLLIKFEPPSPTDSLHQPEFMLGSADGGSFETGEKEDRIPPELKGFSALSDSADGRDGAGPAEWPSEVCVKQEPVSLAAQLVQAFSAPHTHEQPAVRPAKRCTPASSRGANAEVDIFPVYLYRNGQIVQMYQKESV